MQRAWTPALSSRALTGFGEETGTEAEGEWLRQIQRSWRRWRLPFVRAARCAWSTKVT